METTTYDLLGLFLHIARMSSLRQGTFFSSAACNPVPPTVSTCQETSQAGSSISHNSVLELPVVLPELRRQMFQFL